MANDPSHIAIVMIGVNDRYSLGSRRSPKADAEWRTEYGARVDQAMKILKKGGRAVYWVGLPNMRRWQDNERAQMMNDIYRERAYLNGVRYIDAYASFIDEDGGYSDYGPDVTGKVRRLRDTDGIHFTEAGYRKLAHFVERELKRDLAQARLERAVPLAGDPGEQARVNPDRARLKAESSRQEPKSKTAKSGAPAPAAANAGAREQKAEVGKVDIKVAGPGGTEQVLTVDIVRPAIPGLGGGADDAPLERRSRRADGRHPGRPDSRRAHRDELDRAAARQRRTPPAVADADAVLPRVRARRAARPEAGPRGRLLLAAPARRRGYG